MDLDTASRIASGWYSPSEPHLVALATCKTYGWTPEGLIAEIDANLVMVRRNPQNFDDPNGDEHELNALALWAHGQRPLPPLYLQSRSLPEWTDDERSEWEPDGLVWSRDSQSWV